MTKVYEVIERSGRRSRPVVLTEAFDRERAGRETILNIEEKRRKGPEVLTETEPRRVSRQAPTLNIDEIMLGLYQSIKSCLPDMTHRVIQFVGSRKGEGTSTLVREFARVIVAKEGKSILVLDADRVNPTQLRFFNTQPPHTLAEVFKDDEFMDSAICRVGDSNLWVGLVSASPEAESEVVESPYFDRAWNALLQRFDLVLIDSPPVTTFADNIVMARKSDGIIVVVEAEKTRWPVINSVKERLTENGGNVLGVLLNKRQYYIPEWVYSRL